MTGPRAHAGPAGCSPAVTVIVPTRDRACYLGEAIGSVLGQTFADCRRLHPSGIDQHASLLAASSAATL